MSEYSMLETLMSLSLFHGTSFEQIKNFVAKMHLDFNTFNPGEKVVNKGDGCKSLKCLLSGSVEIEKSFFSKNIKVKSLLHAQAFFAPERLFGLDNHYNFSATALNRCGVMDLSKQQYIALMRSDTVYLLNYLNCTCLGLQRAENFLETGSHDSIISFLKSIVNVSTVTQSDDIRLQFFNKTFKEFVKSDGFTDMRSLESLETAEIIKFEGDRLIRVIDRKSFLEWE